MPVLLAAFDGIAAVTMGNGTTPANANRIARDDQRRRQLPALEFVCRRFSAIQDIVDQSSNHVPLR